MGTEAKEGAKLHSNNSSTPSAPRRPGSAPAKRQPASEPLEQCAAADDKPMPSYLRPTISSCRSTGRQPPPPSAKKPAVDRAHSSSSLLKERSPKPSSPMPRPSVNASKPKTAKSPVLSKSKSLSRAGIDAVKKREGKQEERVIATSALLSKSSSFSRISTSGVTKKVEARQEVNIKEPVELKNEEEEDEKPKVDVERKNERAVVLKRQESKGRESSQPYNEVIEETANRLAAERRNKVKALVGAFETVISLQEPEGQQSPQKGETKVASPQKGETKVNAIVGEKVEETVVNLVKSVRKEEETKVNSLARDGEEEEETGVEVEELIKINKIEDKKLDRKNVTEQISQECVREEDKEVNRQEKANQVSQDNVQEEIIKEGQQEGSNEIVELMRSREEVNAGEEVNATELTKSTEEKNSAEKKLAQL